MRGGIGNMMKQVQKMQDDLKKAQEQLAMEEVEGESGGGLIKVIMNGKHEVKRVSIDHSLMGDDKDMLEDLVAAAMNAAVHKVADKTKDKMSGVTGGMGLPPGFKLPF